MSEHDEQNPRNTNAGDNQAPQPAPAPQSPAPNAGTPQDEPHIIPAPPVPDSQKEPNRRRLTVIPRAEDNPPDDNQDSGNGFFSSNPNYTSPTALFWWAIFGFFFGILAIFVTWLVVRNEESSAKSKAIMYCVMGWSISVFVGMMFLLFGGGSFLFPNTGSSSIGGVSSGGAVW